MSIFNVVADEVKRTRDLSRRYRGEQIIKSAARMGAEIQMMRAHRKLIREHTRRDGSLNGTTPTGDLHMVEYEACKFLCPALDNPNGEGRKAAWQWVLSQPWGEEFRCSPIEKRFR